MSAPFPHLSRAPITEAVLDLRVELPDGTSVTTLISEFQVLVHARYPDARPIKQIQFEIPDPFTAAASAGLSQPRDLGTICWSSDNTRAVQARLDGTSVNHVGAYEEWSSILGEMRENWAVFMKVAKPVRVTRCAARFINKFDVPAERDLATIFKTRAEVGEGLPQNMDELLLRVMLGFGHQRRAVITQSTVPTDSAADPKTRSLILDIDAFSTVDLAPESDEIWREFDELRRIKNQCFFESLRHETWKAFE